MARSGWGTPYTLRWSIHNLSEDRALRARYPRAMERPVLPKRGRGGLHKGEKRVAVLGTQDLFKLFECGDVDVLLAKLREVGIDRYVTGWNENRHVIVSDYDLPEEMRERARQIARESSTWVG